MSTDTSMVMMVELCEYETDFYARQHAIARMCHANSACPSVRHTRALRQNG